MKYTINDKVKVNGKEAEVVEIIGNVYKVELETTVSLIPEIPGMDTKQVMIVKENEIDKSEEKVEIKNPVIPRRVNKGINVDELIEALTAEDMAVLDKIGDGIEKMKKDGSEFGLELFRGVATIYVYNVIKEYKCFGSEIPMGIVNMLAI